MLSQFHDDRIRPSSHFKFIRCVDKKIDRQTNLYSANNGINYFLKKYGSDDQAENSCDMREFLIRELYFGPLYQAALGENYAPNISLVYDQTKFLETGAEAAPSLMKTRGHTGLNTLDGIYLASQSLGDFTNLIGLQIERFKFFKASEMLLSLTLFGEKDWNQGNILVINNKLGKVDHGWSGALRYSNLTAMISFMLRQALKYDLLLMDLDIDDFAKSLNHLVAIFDDANLTHYKQTLSNYLQRLGDEVSNNPKSVINSRYYFPSTQNEKHLKRGSLEKDASHFLDNLDKEIKRTLKFVHELKEIFNNVKEDIEVHDFKVKGNNWLILLWFKIVEPQVYQEVLSENASQCALTLALMKSAAPLMHGLSTKILSRKSKSRQTNYAHQRLACLKQTADGLLKAIEKNEAYDEKLVKAAISHVESHLSYDLLWNHPEIFQTLKYQLISNFSREQLKASQALTIHERLAMLKSIEITISSDVIQVFVVVGDAVFNLCKDSAFTRFELGYLAATYAFKELYPQKDIPLFSMEQGAKWLIYYFFDFKEPAKHEAVSFG